MCVLFFFFNIYLFIWLQQVFVVACRFFSCGIQLLGCSMWSPVPWPGIELQPPALRAWSLSHWTTREVPYACVLKAPQTLFSMPHWLDLGICPFLDQSLRKWKSLSRVRLFATSSTIQSMEFSRPEYWSWVAFAFSRDLPNPGIKLRSPTLQVDSLLAEPPGKPSHWEKGLELPQGA